MIHLFPIRASLTSISLPLRVVLPAVLKAHAPDLRTTDLNALNHSWTWNLGPTRMRG